jgi:hypothetical protein
VEALARAGFAGWVVYEYDRAWLGGKGPQPDVDAVLAASARRLFEWIGRDALPQRPDLEKVS